MSFNNLLVSQCPNVSSYIETRIDKRMNVKSNNTAITSIKIKEYQLGRNVKTKI